jgi:hypothetical protein
MISFDICEKLVVFEGKLALVGGALFGIHEEVLSLP